MAGRSRPRHTHTSLGWLSKHLQQLSSLGLIVLLLSSCGSGGSASQSGEIPQSVAINPANLGKAKSGPADVQPVSLVNVHYILPTAITQHASSLEQRNPQDARFRKPEYISTSNASISVVVTPVGGTPMSPVVGSCTTGSCVVSFTANTGPNTLAFTLTDNPLGTGKLLASFSMMTIVQPVPITTLNLTANPVVNSVTVGLGSTLTPAGIATSVPLTITALDADSNTIVGPGNYVDATGAPLALLLGVSQSANGGSGSVTIKGPNRITGPNQATIYAQYDGKPLSSATFTLTSNGTIAAGTGSATLNVQPTTNQEYTVTTASSSPHGLTIGPDRNLWFTEQSTNKIGIITTSGAVTEYTIPSAASNPYGIITGPDGAMWFAEYATSKIGRCTLSGSFTEQATTTSAAKPEFLTIGPDGNIWFSEFSANKIGVLVPGMPSSMVEYTVPTAGSQPRGIINGPDGNVWFTEWTGNKIGKISTSGVITEYTIPTAGSQPNFIITGPDGNLWFTEATGNKIGKITTSGTITEYTITTAASQPYAIIIGTDNNLWFAEKAGNQIGRITTSGVVSEYPVTTAASQPYGLVLGSDNNYWFTEGNVNQIGKFVP